MRYPAKPKPGDRVAVISPSAGLPAVYPDVYEMGLRRLRDDFGLEPVEFPTTRAVGAPARDRARDVEAAFRDPSVTAVLATIGGDDLIAVVPHIDPAVLRANPKPFFGYSDNTNLLHLLYTQGVVVLPRRLGDGAPRPRRRRCTRSRRLRCAPRSSRPAGFR